MTEDEALKRATEWSRAMAEEAAAIPSGSTRCPFAGLNAAGSSASGRCPFTGVVAVTGSVTKAPFPDDKGDDFKRALSETERGVSRNVHGRRMTAAASSVPP